MYASDYPHDQCMFPKSPDVLFSWRGLSDETLGKITSGNAEQYLRLL
jgi:hypothetical protein